MNCFCGMVDGRKTFSLISSQDHCQRSSPSRISDTPRAGFEPAQNLSSGFVEWSCAVVITTTPQCHKRHAHRHKRCTLWYPLSFWVPICTQKMVHPHNSEPALKIFLVLAQGKAQEVHGNYFNGLFKKNSCSVQLGHFGTQLGLKTGGSS